MTLSRIEFRNIIRKGHSVVVCQVCREDIAVGVGGVYPFYCVIVRLHISPYRNDDSVWLECCEKLLAVGDQIISVECSE